MKKSLYALALAIGLSFITGFFTTALGDEFYKGKTIRLIVGFKAGGGFDTYTRLVARHIGKHIPGNPNVIVENMTGGGSVIAANYGYRKARPDGLTAVVFHNYLVLQQALGLKGIQFDAREFGWVGAPSVGTPTCGIMGFTGLKTLDDVLNSNKEISIGADAPGSAVHDIPSLMVGLMGAPFRVVRGYRGSAGVRAAVQRREVDGYCSSWESMRATARAMLDAEGDDKFIPYIVEGKSEDPEVKDLPQFTDVLKGENLAIFKAWLNPQKFYRPIALPPKTPKGRLETLRAALKKTMDDPALKTEAKKAKVILTYVSGEQIDGYVEEILSLSPAGREKLRSLIGSKD